ncbi:EamA family transporter [Candidatus Woesearchaeota archaeon]|nr:EamA family transporter [Candidatus Woesearchaeota archaeon]
MIKVQLLIAIIISLFAWTGGNIIDKFILSKKNTNSYTYTVTSVSILFIESIIISLFLNWNGITLAALTLPFISGILSAVSFIAYYYLLKQEEASQILPLLYLTPIGLILIHVFFFESSFTYSQIFGIIAAVLGTIILESHKTIKELFAQKTTIIGIVYGLLISIPIVMNESASHMMPYWNIQLPFATGVIITVSLLLFRKDVRKTLLKHYKLYPYTIVSEALGMTGNLAFWYALAFITSPLLAAIGNIQPLIIFGFTTLISIYYPHIIKEDLHRKTLLRKFIGIALIVVGTAVIAYTIS